MPTDVRRPENLHTQNVLSLREAAAYIGFTVQDFQKWAELALLPAADANTSRWTKESLDKALDDLTRNGWPAHHDLPDIQRQPRTDSLGRKRRHHYRRGVAGPIDGEPGTGRYMASLIEKNRQFCREQAAAERAQSLREPNQNEDSDTNSPVVAEQRAKPPPLPSDAILRMGGVIPSDYPLPLYPTEWELGIAVLGLQRASEWPELAARLEHEGLPVADPLTGARFRPAVEAFFLARHGLDGGLAARKGAASRQPQTKLIVRAPQAVQHNEVSNPTEQDFLLPEELFERWRGRVAIETLSNWRSQGVGPPATKIGRAILYRIDLLEAWERDRLAPEPKP